MMVQPYLFFDGRCEEALDFYQKELGVEILSSMRFKDHPDAGSGSCGEGGGPAPGPEKIMHASFKLGESIIMVSDGNCQGKTRFDGFSLALSVKDKAEAERIFAVLGEGGQVCAPMVETFFSPAFGMLIDRFGVSWMVLVGQ